MVHLPKIAVPLDLERIESGAGDIIAVWFGQSWSLELSGLKLELGMWLEIQRERGLKLWL